MENRIKHPSFVTVGISRVSGNAKRLFGSNTRSNTLYTLTVKEAEYVEDSRFGGHTIFGRRVLMEIDFTPTQFAELFTSLNVGDGTPGTLTFSERGRVDQGPEVRTALDRATEEANTHFSTLAQAVAEKLEPLKGLNLNKKDQKTVNEVIDAVHRHVLSESTSVVDTCKEAVAKTLSAAKQDMLAFTRTIRRMPRKTV